MWKRDEEQPIRPTGAVPQATTTTQEPPRAAVAPRTGGGASIGPSIVVKGEVTGDEDLFIHGQVDGSVALDLHAVTVGNVGRVKANITGRIITVEGSVEGNLRAQEQIILRGSANVHGDLKAPRIVLEDGATFRGLIDMGVPKNASGAQATAATKPQPPATTESSAANAKADAGAAKEPARAPAVAAATAKGRDAPTTGAGR